MRRFFDTATVLRDLQAAVGDRDGSHLADHLDQLLVLAVRSVPSCLAVSLTLTDAGQPVTVTALSTAALLDPVRSSLALHLPYSTTRPDTSGGPDRAGGPDASEGTGRNGTPATGNENGALLVLYAAEPAAFTHLAADLLALLDLDPHRAQLDRHLQLPPPAHTATTADTADTEGDRPDDAAAVNRALGVLLDRGLLPDAGHHELHRLATLTGTDIPTAARTLLDNLTPPTPDP